MRSQKSLWVGLGLAAAAILIFGLFYYNMHQRIDWEETYLENSLQPYGSGLLYRMLQSEVDTSSGRWQVLREKLATALPIDSSGRSLYFFLGESPNFDSLDYQRLLDFAALGNTVLLASKSLPGELLTYHVYYGECAADRWEGLEYQYAEEVQLELLHPELSEGKSNLLVADYYSPRGAYGQYPWQYFDPGYFCEAPHSLTPLGKLQPQDEWVDEGWTGIYFAEGRYKEGQFLLHANPLLFTNYFLMEESGRVYASAVLGHAQAFDTLYWDAYSREAEGIGQARNRRAGFQDDSAPRDSPLQYILSQPALAWAWYLLLSMALVFLVFRAKRRQRIIPVWPKKRNTSLAFVQSLGTLSYLQKQHLPLIEQKMDHFLSYIRHRYQLDTQNRGDAFAHQLSQVAELPLEKVQQIFNTFTRLRGKGYATEGELIDFHQLLSDFYQQAK